VKAHLTLITGRWTTFITLLIICSRRSAGRRKWSHSLNSCTSSPYRTVAHVPSYPPTSCTERRALGQGHLLLHLPPQVRAHAHGSSKPSAAGVFSVCFSATTKNHGFTFATDGLLWRPPYLAKHLEQFQILVVFKRLGWLEIKLKIWRWVCKL
jgi:hypothetical protein